ncbi:MAG TPA: hypothetical protein VMW86_08995 [Dehalococcoidales bacterium]|nr:hypothetical protein [Dehalococcoidales bacterium]
MRVKYKAWRAGGEDMTGRIVDMDDAEAETLIRCNIVEAVPVEVEVETATITPPENTMVKLNKKKKKH